MMDINVNEDQLGDLEPRPEEAADLEAAVEGEALGPEAGEEDQPSDASEAILEPQAVEEDPAPVAEATQAGDLAAPEDEEDLPAAEEAEEIQEEPGLDEDLLEEVEEALVEDPALAEELVSESEEVQEELLEPAAEQSPEEARQEEVPLDPYASASVLEGEPVKEPDDGRAWYVVHCYSGNEDKVRHNIMQRIESMSMDDLIFDVVVPTEDEVNIKNGERQTVEKKVFPGYILVNMILTEESWYMVRNTPGVTGFVGMGNDPTPLQPEEVARILKRMESESPRINVTFRPGERVRIVDGPFEDFYGKVSEIDMERATVRVMVNFFGRETPVELDFLQVEPA